MGGNMHDVAVSRGFGVAMFLFACVICGVVGFFAGSLITMALV